MPFKSKSQIRRFATMVKTGEISKETYDKWVDETDTELLPEKVKVPKARPSHHIERPIKATGRK